MENARLNNLLAEVLYKRKCLNEGITYVPFEERNAQIQQSSNEDKTTENKNTSIQSVSDNASIQRDNNNLTLSDDKTLKEVQETTDKYGNVITYNSKQREFITLATSGQSCVLLGAAGTGKTTCQKGVLNAFLQSKQTGYLNAPDHRHLPHQEGKYPGIVICAFTKRAVNNIKRNMPEEIQPLCLTIHKLLEYQPVQYTVSDPETGLDRNTMRFEATRNRFNPLPSSIKTIIIEESSMVSVDLEGEIRSALDHEVQFIYLGDIQQLPPVFGSAILGFKMNSLPVIELTEVYRQALESPIIRLAHRILSGKPIPAKEFKDWHYPKQLTIHPWAKRLHPDHAVVRIGLFFTQAIDSGAYDPKEDMILIPFNKALGTLDVNKYIAQHLARKYDKPVYHIIAGFNNHYFTIGDKVLYDKEDAEILSIVPNKTYLGKNPSPPSKTMDYFGQDTAPRAANLNKDGNDTSLDDIDDLMDIMGSIDDEDKVNSASHEITLYLSDTDRTVTIKAASEINSMLLGYAMTVHKAQGSEWRKVFLVLHQSHATMIQRELLYTAVTRPREELYIICEPDTFEKGITGQRIKGNTLAEKAEYFKGKMEESKYKNVR